MPKLLKNARLHNLRAKEGKTNILAALKRVKKNCGRGPGCGGGHLGIRGAYEAGILFYFCGAGIGSGCNLYASVWLQPGRILQGFLSGRDFALVLTPRRFVCPVGFCRVSALIFQSAPQFLTQSIFFHSSFGVEAMVRRTQ